MAYITELSIRNRDGEYSYLFTDKEGDRESENGFKQFIGNIDRLSIYFDRDAYSRNEMIVSACNYIDNRINNEIADLGLSLKAVENMRFRYKEGK
jgi:hypothetical protein